MTTTLDLSQSHIEKQSPSVLALSKARLIELWEIGVLPAGAYIALAIEYEREVNGSESINVDNFVFEWQTVTADGKEKELKKAQVMSTLAALEKKQLIRTNIRQIELQFDY